MLHKNSLFLFLSSLVLLISSSANADVRIATVDVGRILNESPEALANKKELDALSQEAKKKADAKRKDLQVLEAKLKEKKVTEDSKEAESFRAQAKEYARFIKDTEDDIKKRFIKVNKDITEKAVARITAYAKANNIDLVLDKSDKYRGPVLYGTKTTEITEEILKGMS